LQVKQAARGHAARCARHAVAEPVVDVGHPGGREQAVGAIPSIRVHAVVREVASCVIAIAQIGDLIA